MINTETGKVVKIETKQIILWGMFIVLSFVGSFMKIPSPYGTVALDSAPAFLAALLLGPIPGAIVAFMGHILTSLNVGYPLSLPIHFLIATEMAVICVTIGIIAKRGYVILALIVGLLLNGIVAPALFILLPKFGMPFFAMMLVPLLIGSAINLIVANILFRILKGRVTV